MLLKESREQVRKPADGDTSCRLLLAVGGVVVTPVAIKDLSASGIGLVLPRRFEQGATFTVELINRRNNFELGALVRVVHVTPQALGKWLVGLLFIERLTGDQLKALL